MFLRFMLLTQETGGGKREVLEQSIPFGELYTSEWYGSVSW